MTCLYEQGLQLWKDIAQQDLQQPISKLQDKCLRLDEVQRVPHTAAHPKEQSANVCSATALLDFQGT